MTTILNFTEDRLEKVIAWARYLYWSDLHRQKFDTFVKANENDSDGCRFVALMSSWYASLWVVVEGWRDIPLADPAVDELLDAAPRYQKLLKRYRHGVYHYQPRLINGRLTDFLQQGQSAVYWAHLLHEQFCHFYWQLFASPPIPANLVAEIREVIIGVVGWIPEDILIARIESVRQRGRDAVTMLRNAGDFTSDAARDVLDAARQCEEVAMTASLDIRGWRAGLLERIRTEARRH